MIALGDVALLRPFALALLPLVVAAILFVRPLVPQLAAR